MKVLSIKKVGKQKVYDISVKEHEHYILENGVVTHNTGIYYSANQIFVITKTPVKDKKTNEILGFNFTIHIEKSRTVKEKSKLSFDVLWDEGIYKYSGLFELAVEFGFIVQSGGWYQLVDTTTGELNEKKIREKEITDEYYDKLLVCEQFKEYVKNKFMS